MERQEISLYMQKMARYIDGLASNPGFPSSLTVWKSAIENSWEDWERGYRYIGVGRNCIGSLIPSHLFSATLCIATSHCIITMVLEVMTSPLTNQ